MKDNYSLYPEKYDIHNCDAEPLHNIHCIQEFAELLIVSRDLSAWYYASENLLPLLDTTEIIDIIRSFSEVDNFDLHNSAHYNQGGKYNLTTYITDDWIALELERPNIGGSKIDNPLIRESIVDIMGAEDLDAFLKTIVKEVKQTLNYDHVMLYKFDFDNSGKVLLEEKEDFMPSYKGLKFPASDIPKQARALYESSKVRSVFDVTHNPKRLFKNKSNGQKPGLDLSMVHSRGVSPIHVEYLKNMKVNSSFSLAINYNDRLWGLIACHHRSPRYLDYNEREWLKFLSSLVSGKMKGEVASGDKMNAIKYELLNNEVLLGISNSEDLITTFKENGDQLLSAFAADGLGVYINGNYHEQGTALDRKQVFSLVSEIESDKNRKDIISNDSLLEGIGSVTDTIAGYLFISLSQETKNFIIFYRKEMKFKEEWAGDPNYTKTYNATENRLSPRKSFEKWGTEVSGKSMPWSSMDHSRAEYLKTNILNAVYQRYAELEQMHKELEFAHAELNKFSSVLSHDLKSPLRSIQNFSQILKEDFSGGLDAKGIEILDTIYDNSIKMKNYIDGILKYSKYAHSPLNIKKIELSSIIKKEVKNIQLQSNGLKIVERLDLDYIFGDEIMLIQVVNNLLENAAEYSSKNHIPEISISTTQVGDFAEIMITDNGIGVPDKMKKSIFDMYRRGVSDKEYEGSGLGLSIVKNIIERHHGNIEVKDNNPEGTIFVIRIPKNSKQ